MFKIGDRIICIDNHGLNNQHITIGKRYIVKDYYFLKDHIMIERDDKILSNYWYGRFILDNKYVRKNKVKRILCLE